VDTRLALLLIVGCSGVAGAAEPPWQRIGETDFYVDVDSIERIDPLVVASVLQNYSTEHRLPVSGVTYRSTVTLRAFDCAARQATTISYDLFAERDAGGGQTGHAVSEESDLQWEDAEAGTQGRALLDFVCSRAPPP
jgi:hypothetical protein